MVLHSNCYWRLVLIVLTAVSVSIVVVATEQAGEEASPTTASRRTEKTNNDELDSIFENIQPKIVRGEDAPVGRYPYFVSLTDRDMSHVCGGTLIAPNIVLSAAHCQAAVLEYARIGIYTASDDSYETIRIAKEFRNPQYRDDNLRWDQVVLMLENDASDDAVYIPFNKERDVPDNLQPLKIMGFGTTREGFNSPPVVLQQGDVFYITNGNCRQAKDPFTGQSYGNSITRDMMCATNLSTLTDSCQGDSGGPLVILGNDATQDVLVGVVSWGFGCGSGFPGVYSRTSATVEWIEQLVCLLVDNEQFLSGMECLETYSPAPTPSPTITPKPTGGNDVILPLRLFFVLDNCPFEFAWSIFSLDADDNKEVLYSVPFQSYTFEDEVEVTVEINVDPNLRYFFVARDSFGDGLVGTGTGIWIYVQDALILQIDGNAFGGREEFELDLPERQQPMVPVGQILCTLEIQMDEFPSDIGFYLNQVNVLDTTEVATAQPGVFIVPNQLVVRTYTLQANKLHTLRVVDNFGDGIKGNGFVRLFLGTATTDNDNDLIFFQSGDFGYGFEYEFTSSRGVPINEDDNNDADRPVGDDYLILELYTDLFPEEISVALLSNNTKTSGTDNGDEDGDDNVLYYRPPRHFGGKQTQLVTEIIPLPLIPIGSTLSLEFIIQDTQGDGLCCLWNGDAEYTGYKLYYATTAMGTEERTEIIESRMADVDKESTPFTIPLIPSNNDTTGVDMPPIEIEFDPDEVVVLRLIIILDLFPEETGIKITNLETNQIVFNAPPGIFAEQYLGFIDEMLFLPVGIYEFNLLDSYGDGINGFTEDLEDFFAFVELTLDSMYDETFTNYSPLIFIWGDTFTTSETKIFAVEHLENANNTASSGLPAMKKYPLEISFPTGMSPWEFGYRIYRLDYPQADALVADVPFGWFADPQSQLSLTIQLQVGGLYSIEFFDFLGNGIRGKISIRLGPQDIDNPRAIFVDGVVGEFDPVNVIAINEQDKPILSSRMLTLKIIFDSYPGEVSWLLAAKRNNDIVIDEDAAVQRQQQGTKTITFVHRTVLAFGPQDGPYPKSFSGKEYTETISLPILFDPQDFDLIVRDSSGDGVCCNFGQGGPIKLLDNNDDVIFSIPFNETSRAVQTFTLPGEPRVCTKQVNIDACGPLVQTVIENEQDCDCFNFCNNEFAGCCNFADPSCVVDSCMEESEITAAGCTLEHAVDDGTNSDAPTAAPIVSPSPPTSTSAASLPLPSVLLFGSSWMSCFVAVVLLFIGCIIF